MTAIAPKVELGFDLAAGVGPFLVLDDPVAGKLDDPEWTLGGTIFYDVTEYVRSVVISRGRSSLFSQFPAGNATVQFNNHNRYFDPLYTASPFVGNIIPKREIRISAGTEIQFTGWVDDWNLTYAPNGNSLADALAYDATGLLASRTLASATPSVQTTGQRINAILDDPSVNWASTLRTIDTGQATLSDFPISDNQNVLAYLQTVASSEPGNLFIGKSGNVVFQDRTKSPTSTDLVQFGGTGIPFQNLEVVYGSENLYNEIVISRQGGGTAVATDIDSIGEYGIFNLTINNLLLSSDEQSVDLALIYAQQYSQPEYRFNALEVAMHKLDIAEQEEISKLEIGSICKVIFTPNGIGDPIERFVEVIRLEQTITPEVYFINLGFQAIDFASLVLDDAEFGKLDTYSLSW
jgi:hypothetical protein